MLISIILKVKKKSQLLDKNLIKSQPKDLFHT